MSDIATIRQRHSANPDATFTVDGRFVITGMSTKEGRNGVFATVDLRDPSGQLVARCFDSDRIEALGSAGLINASLKISSFNGTISAVIGEFESVTASTDEMLQFAGLDPDAHAKRVARIRTWIDECDGTVYGDVLRAAFDDATWQAFCMAPAAVRLHHAEPGGLVRHVCEVGDAGLALLDSTGAPYDRAYFLAGVLLHDIGKIDAYTQPPNIAYAAQGQMAEHQIWSTFRAGKACAAVNAPASIEARVVHIIEQAHGAYRHAEWQDPIGVEAKALASADYFSSRLGTTDKEQRAQDALDALIASDATSASAGGSGAGGAGANPLQMFSVS